MNTQIKKLEVEQQLVQKDDAKFEKFHYKAMKPDSFEFKTFDFDDE